MQLPVWLGSAPDRAVVELSEGFAASPHAGDLNATAARNAGMGIRLKLALVVAFVFAVGCAASTYRYLDGRGLPRAGSTAELAVR